MTTFEGSQDGKGLHIAIIVSRFNELVTERLLQGALTALKEKGASEEAIDVVWVPGSLEIPLVAKTLTKKGYHAIICLGAVIRGQTLHFEYVAGESARGIAKVSRTTNTPVIFGVLTTDNIDHALDRARPDPTNRGYQAALSAIEMARLMEKLTS